jgi:hypothetical protein
MINDCIWREYTCQDFSAEGRGKFDMPNGPVEKGTFLKLLLLLDKK